MIEQEYQGLEQVNSNFENSIKVNATESVDNWSGLYLGVYESEDKLSANATSTSFPDDPYSVSTDKDKNNLGTRSKVNLTAVPNESYINNTRRTLLNWN